MDATVPLDPERCCMGIRVGLSAGTVSTMSKGEHLEALPFRNTRNANG